MELSGPERAFLGASVNERDREAEQVLEREHRVVAAEHRQRRRGRQLAVVGLVTVLVAALAVFGTVQWRSAVQAKGDVDSLLMVNDLVAASEQALDYDPQLALLLAMQSVRETVALGFASEEPSTRSTSRFKGSACNTTWCLALQSPSDRGHAAASACMRSHQAS